MAQKTQRRRGAYAPGRRKKSHDTMLAPGATQEQIQTDMALGSFDRAVNEMDVKWGVDRLVELVPADVAAKYGLALGRLNEAVRDSDVELTQRRVKDCLKGLAALDGLATQRGAQPASDAYWELELDGLKAAVVADMDAWQRIQAERPDLELVSLREMGLAWKAYREGRLGVMAAEVKQHFPGSNVVRIGKKPEDPIPF